MAASFFFWKAAYPSGSVDISTPRRWRGDWLHHHGDGVDHVVFVFCVVLSGHCCLTYADEYERITLRWGYGCDQVGHLGLHHTKDSA